MRPKPKSVINKSSKTNNSCNNLNLKMSNDCYQENKAISFYKSSTCSPSNMSNMTHGTGQQSTSQD